MTKTDGFKRIERMTLTQLRAESRALRARKTLTPLQRARLKVVRKAIEIRVEQRDPVKAFARRFSHALEQGRRAKKPTVRKPGDDFARPEWGAAPSLSKGPRHTWYAAIKVRRDVFGGVSDVQKVDAKAAPRIITVALLGVVGSGKRKGELRPLTGRELAANFDRLLAEAIRRHGLVPVKGDYVRGIFRHKVN